MSTATQLFLKAFLPRRTERSPAYALGVLDGARHRLGEGKTTCPYKLGTSDADAWYAGRDDIMAARETYTAEDSF